MRALNMLEMEWVSGGTALETGDASGQVTNINGNEDASNDSGGVSVHGVAEVAAEGAGAAAGAQAAAVITGTEVGTGLGGVLGAALGAVAGYIAVNVKALPGSASTTQEDLALAGMP